MPKLGPHINMPPRAVQAGVLIQPHLTYCPQCARPTAQVFYGNLIWLEVNGERVAVCLDGAWEEEAKHQGVRPGDVVRTIPVRADERVPGIALCASCGARQRQIEEEEGDE